MNTVENLQPGQVYACSQECPVFVSGPEQTEDSPLLDVYGAYNVAFRLFEAEATFLQEKLEGEEDLSLTESGTLFKFRSIKRNRNRVTHGKPLSGEFADDLGRITIGGLINFLDRRILSQEHPITEYKEIKEILLRNSTPDHQFLVPSSIEPIIEPIVVDVPPFLSREHIYHPEQRLRELKRGSFPWGKALALGLLTAFALWALSKGSPFVRQPDTNPAGQVTITQLYPSPDTVLGGHVPVGSVGLPEPQVVPSPFTTFINSRVIVQPGDTVWDLVKRAQIESFGEGWVNSENGAERADAVAGIVVEKIKLLGVDPNQLRVGGEFSMSNYIQTEEDTTLIKAASESESVDQYQEVVAPKVREMIGNTL